MTRFAFDARAGLIVVSVRIQGPAGIVGARLALDTGATTTLVRTAIMVSLGFDPAGSPDRVRISTASGVEFAARVVADRLEALGRNREAFPILCHTLPPSTTVDGLLGLDFLRGSVLSINLVEGFVELRS